MSEQAKLIKHSSTGLYVKEVSFDLKNNCTGVILTNYGEDAMRFNPNSDDAELFIGDSNGGVLSVPFDDNDGGANYFHVVTEFVGTRPVRPTE